MKKQSGFTLTELMVTLTVAVILLALAVPNFTEMVRNNRMTAQANDFVTAFQLARSEAIKRSAQIQVIALGGSWANGWDVQLADGTVLRTFPAIYTGYTLTEAGALTTIAYQSTGRVTAAANFSLCDGTRAGETGRTVTILVTGRISVSNLVCP